MTERHILPRRVTRALNRRQLLFAGVPAGLLVVTGCGSQPETADGGLVANPAKHEWPALYREAAPEIQEAYRFAIANPQVLQYIPCMCGCSELGHTSVYDCYVREVRPAGSVVLDPMSFG